MSNKISFEEAFAQAVNEAIRILGKVVSKIVTDYLEQKYSVHLTRTSNNPSALDEALDHAIDGGRLIIERRIINLLYEKLGLEAYASGTNAGDKTTASFEQRINEARQRYSN